jgi:hypothetical protein
VIARWKGIVEEIHFGGSIMPLAIIENLDLEKTSFRPSKWPRKRSPTVTRLITVPSQTLDDKGVPLKPIKL